MYKGYIKPVFDRFFAALALVIASPVILLTIIALFFHFNGKVWFVQERPGKGGRPFYLIKFKTMRDVYDAQGSLLPDEHRLTWLGKLIRKTSLDELPQLINVIKGDMSLVGPRPLLTEYLPLYNDFQRRRHEVKPGITGWAQVNGRNEVDWNERFAHDVWYVDHVSFMLDFKIILLTVLKVLKAEGISSKNSATMEKFRGNS
ncbi:MAG: sugar transferase [Chitinophagaceae bacterium]|nr:sugar transferase [Chitinophagaceae bacterium]